MQEYLNLVKNIIENGTEKTNRTGINTKSITGAMLKFDMREGFPIITTRKIPIKSILTELEFFIKGITNKKWLEDRHCKFWSEWCNPEKVPYDNDDKTKEKMKNEQDLGEIYGYLWNYWKSDNSIVEVPKKIIENTKGISYPLFDLQDIDKCGRIYKNIYGTDYCILSVNKTDNNYSCDIQFNKTGYVIKNLTQEDLKAQTFRDPYYPFAFNVGYLGEKDPITDLYGHEVYKNLYGIWINMLKVCYCKESKLYKYYGGIGTFVDSRWFSLENFLEDVIKLPGWQAKLRYINDYKLSKDYYGSNAFSNNSCVWIPYSDAKLYRDSKAFVVTNLKTKKKKIFISILDCAKEYGITVQKITNLLNTKKHKIGINVFSYINNDKIYRYRLPINQLQHAIETLKTNPTDRRIIVNAWNPILLYKEALPPCHYSFELVSDGTYLDLTFNMRSSDVALGLPANISSYAMLLMLIAEEVHMIPRYLIYFGGDVHIYTNHIDAMKQLLTRKPSSRPIMNIIKSKENNWSIYDWNSQTDWNLEGYNSQDPIKMDVAI